MNVQIVRLNPISIIKVSHIGPYEELGPKFESLWSWIEQNNIPATRSIGIYYDNPEHVPANRLRSAACVEVPDGYIITANGAPGFVATLAGGDYATMTYTGPYEAMEPVWTQFTSYVESILNRTVRENDPAFEVYVNDPANTPPDQLITEMYLPV